MRLSFHCTALPNHCPHCINTTSSAGARGRACGQVLKTTPLISSGYFQEMIEYGAVFCVFSHSTNRLAGGVPFAVRNNPPSYLRKRVGDVDRRWPIHKVIRALIAEAVKGNTWQEFVNPTATRGKTAYPKTSADQEKFCICFNYDKVIGQEDMMGRSAICSRCSSTPERYRRLSRFGGKRTALMQSWREFWLRKGRPWKRSRRPLTASSSPLTTVCRLYLPSS